MTEQEYIRKAVELADGFEWSDTFNGRPVEITFDDLSFCLFSGDEIPTSFKDALAAQLVRQVDRALAFLDWGQLSRPFYKDNGPDRTMNTIRVIVDSKVLEP